MYIYIYIFVVHSIYKVNLFEKKKENHETHEVTFV